MKHALDITAKIENGRFMPYVSDFIRKQLPRFEGKAMRLTMHEVGKKRTLRQNNYYFGVVVPAIAYWMTECGNDADNEDVHEHLKKHVGNLKKIIEVDGVKYTITGSTRNLSTVDFNNYVEKCRAWAASFDVQIPLPNEVGGYFLTGDTTESEVA